MHSLSPLPMSASSSSSSLPLRPPQWTSHRRLLDRHLSDLHRCSNPSHISQLHSQIYRSGLHQDPSLLPKLISAYSLSRHISNAHKVFDQIPHPTTLHFNTLIRAFAYNSHPTNSFKLFASMMESSVPPDNYTYPFLLKACVGGTSALNSIKMVHTHVVKFGFLADIFVPNSLIDAYAKTGVGIKLARQLFDEMPEWDVVSWNTVIGGLVRDGKVREARDMFDEMPERDIVSCNTMLDGHSKVGEMDKAFELFGNMGERNVVSWSTMISGYCKSGEIDMARMLFDKMPTTKNLVVWTIMISGYAAKGSAKEAYLLLDRMEETGLHMDVATVVSILSACAESGLLGLGKRIHNYIEKSRLRVTVQVRNALVDMYSKCGKLEKALSVFEEMGERDLVSWNSMVQGLANHGQGERALELFDRMRDAGIKPDSVTLVGVLCACTHVGLIKEARYYFDNMERDFGIVPQIEHYGCMIDILGRGGLLKEAFDLARTMPLEPNAIIWGTLLGACRVHNNVGLAEEAVDQLITLNPSDSGNYAILSNIYAAAGQWDGMAKTRIQMKRIQKPAGSSWIELDDSLHEFTVGDRSHPNSRRIFKMVNRLGQHLQQVGYVPKVY
ncbi:pentatricopeptide repeat-containing protein [Iris pallida]|uniref:Pentatricopeptide repeat-containing protein n=1 Tax=Iris pallida TaxID=29817 RepID=A0AAX6EQU7_IRIPA|nr:pentatricopeptide repeat-containing protein [Iris pallida]